MSDKPGSPGSHPHSNRPNWQVAETADDYIRNVQDGLEPYSERRLAKLLGVSRMAVYRWQAMAEIPESLFEELLAQDKPPSRRELAAIGLALEGKGSNRDVESCPHCGGVLRIRRSWTKETEEIVNDWLKRDAAKSD
ncbi:hypothetical protein HBA54_03125 [Pelagibius litoralis]|uniref:Uncharacterized protein n=1 Tax=Pelagibius litoralis TaxID=374515 RepID=A0A967CAP5_9PROT|nr:hypothetical protein [Pelagibius litoralis]NIA67574.1 hypothetical protein [Pelagibius litoralis]